MIRGKLLVHFSLAIALSAGIASNAFAQQSNLSAADIVNKNVSARGGLQAWRSVQTLSDLGS